MAVYISPSPFETRSLRTAHQGEGFF